MKHTQGHPFLILFIRERLCDLANAAILPVIPAAFLKLHQKDFYADRELQKWYSFPMRSKAIEASGQLRVAAFQRYPIYDDVEEAMERVASDLQWCDEQAVDLAVFPECYLQGYTSDLATIAHRAISIDSSKFAEILDRLSSFRASVVLGIIEKRNAAFYNSAAVIQLGRLLGIYSKNNLNESGFSTGNDFPVFQNKDWLFGINICNDANFSDPALRISQQAARLICYPLNNLLSRETASRWREKSVGNLKNRALETGCWVVSSDVTGEQGEKLSYGCTCIVRPDGTVVERVPEGVEGKIVFDLT